MSCSSSSASSSLGSVRLLPLSNPQINSDARTVNTGIQAAWLPLLLHTHPAWKAKALAEVRGFIAKYAPDMGAGVSLAARLAQVPPVAWEDEMPVLDACLRETMRLVLSGTTLRRVVAPQGIAVDGRTIQRGAFLAFLVESTHLDPQIYPEPLKCVAISSLRAASSDRCMCQVGSGPLLPR